RLLEEGAIELEELERHDPHAAVRLEKLLGEPLPGPDVHRGAVERLGPRVALEVTGGDEQRGVGRLVIHVAAAVLDGPAIHRSVASMDADGPAELEAPVLAPRSEQRAVVATLGDLDLPEVERVQHLHARLLQRALLQRREMRAERAR